MYAARPAWTRFKECVIPAQRKHFLIWVYNSPPTHADPQKTLASFTSGSANIAVCSIIQMAGSPLAFAVLCYDHSLTFPEEVSFALQLEFFVT